MPTKEDMERRYVVFMNAIRDGKYETVRTCIDDDFLAAVAGERAPGLRIDAFIKELKFQKHAFPDLGKDISMTITDHGLTYLRVSYVMTATFSGRLTAMLRGYPAMRRGTKVKITSDMVVTFTDATKISLLVGTSVLELP